MRSVLVAVVVAACGAGAAVGQDLAPAGQLVILDAAATADGGMLIVSGSNFGRTPVVTLAGRQLPGVRVSVDGSRLTVPLGVIGPGSHPLVVSRGPLPIETAVFMLTIRAPDPVDDVAPAPSAVPGPPEPDADPEPETVAPAPAPTEAVQGGGAAEETEEPDPVPDAGAASERAGTGEQVTKPLPDNPELRSAPPLGGLPGEAPGEMPVEAPREEVSTPEESSSAGPPAPEFVCGNGTLEGREEFDPPPGPFASAPVDGKTCRYDFGRVRQLYCDGACSWAGPAGCDQDDADLFCRLKTGHPEARATAWTPDMARALPGFACAPMGRGTLVESLGWRGVAVSVRYEDGSLRATHGRGAVVLDPECVVP